ncbi:MAG: hypothetical protein ACXVH3_21205 [Solirubrobacteraceae bacterium]
MVAGGRPDLDVSVEKDEEEEKASGARSGAFLLPHCAGGAAVLSRALRRASGRAYS